jgi:hypothetical protein
MQMGILKMTTFVQKTRVVMRNDEGGGKKGKKKKKTLVSWWAGTWENGNSNGFLVGMWMVNRVGDGNKSTKPNASEGHSEDDNFCAAAKEL